MRRHVTALMAVLTMLAGYAADATAKKPPRGSWEVTRTSDPITGRTSCVVAAYDQAAGLSWTRVGALYPFVELNSEQGLLVGVSSGGRYRVPTGDIVWRVDDRPFRTIRTQDNPQLVAPAATANGDVAAKAMQDMLALTNRMTLAATATSTVAGDERAREMLAEMLAGQGLLFRSAVVPSYGLPGGASQQAGQITDKGVVPYPLDASFRAGLTECGITT